MSDNSNNQDNTTLSVVKVNICTIYITRFDLRITSRLSSALFFCIIGLPYMAVEESGYWENIFLFSPTKDMLWKNKKNINNLW